MAGLYDMVKMTVASAPGTGTITLGIAVTGFQTFASAGVVNGQTVSYSIQDGASWEVGRGIYTASGTTLTRGSIFSSIGGGAITAGASALVWIAVLAEDLQPAPGTGLTATGNNSQSSALTLTTLHNYVSTVTSVANSVKIPALMMVPGQPPVVIVNEGASVLNVFGDTGVSINGGAANASVAISVGAAGLFVVKSSTQLRTVP